MVIKKMRFMVQAGFAIYFLYVGYVFYRYYLWVSGQTDVYVARLPSVEVFLPIGALTSLKHLFLTGEFDGVHPAALVIFLAVLVSALLFRKGICGWVCPVGFVSNLCERLGRRLGFGYCLPKVVSVPLSAFKYLLLGFFVYVILFAMDRDAIEAFLASPYNMLVDIKMLQFFLYPSTTTIVVITMLFIFSILVRNPWCRFFCPYGALLGLLAWGSPMTIKRDESSCIQCKRCSKACPSCISVNQKVFIRTPECQGCMECVGVCPVRDCLKCSVLNKAIPPWWLAIGVLLIILSCWGWAEMAGYWSSRIQPIAIRDLFIATGGHVMHP